MNAQMCEPEVVRDERPDERLTPSAPVRERDVRAAAETYRAAGVGVARIRQGEKRPTNPGWTEKSAEPDEFQSGDNIGLLGGWLSDGGRPGRFLVCVDLDTSEAIEKADEHLPETRAIEGRLGKPSSHWWYFVTDVPDWATSTAEAASTAAAAAGKPTGPGKKQLRHPDTGKTVIDFIGTGGQAAAPPSVHESGEVRAWEPGHGIEHAAVLPFEQLWDAVTALAEACGATVPDVRGVKKPRGRRSLPVIDPIPLPVVPSEVESGPVQGTGTRLDVPMAERVAKCREYLKGADLAQSGSGGHTTTYRIARVVVNDFAVTNRERALVLLTGYNQRLRDAGEEVWTPEELAHKLDDALNAPPDADHLFGCRLLPPRKWDDAGRLADEFLTETTLAFVKDTAFEYDGQAYSVVGKDWLSGEVRLFVEGRAAKEYERSLQQWERDKESLLASAPVPVATNPVDEPGQVAEAVEKGRRKWLQAHQKSKPKAVPRVSPLLVSNVVAAVRARCQWPDDTELDSWRTPGQNPPVLAVANGLLDPVSRALRPHTPDWFSTVRLPVRFDKDAPPPTKWLAFLEEVLEGDAERAAVIQEVFGGCLDRTGPGKWFAMLVGAGDNGKSVVLHVLGQVLGRRNCSSVGLGELTGSRFATFQLFGKLANLVGDQGYLELADEGRLKTLTGGDLVTFEQKGRDPFAAVNRAKLVLACNALPTFGDRSEGVWNRLEPVPFTYTVPAGKKDPALLTDGYWAEELPGILNWALDGLQRLREARGRFTRSAAGEALKGEHRRDSNPARRFLEENYEFTGREEDRMPVSELFADYKGWARENGYDKLLTVPKFAKEVDAAFPGVAKSETGREGKATRKERRGLRKKPGGVTDVTHPPRGASHGSLFTTLDPAKGSGGG